MKAELPQPTTVDELKKLIFDIEIPNFKKWNPDINAKRQWLKLDIHWMNDPKVRKVPASGVTLWLLLLSFRGRSESHLVDLDLTSVGLLWNFQGTSVGLLLLKLAELQLCRIVPKRYRVEKNRSSREDPYRGTKKTKAPDFDQTSTPQVAEITQVSKPPITPPTTKPALRVAPKVATPKNRSEMQVLIGTYVKAWRERYKATNARPDLGGKSQGILRRALQQYRWDQLALMLQVYCQVDDKWFNTKKHDLATFEQNLNKIALCMEKGRSEPGVRTWEDIVDETKGENDEKGALQQTDRTLEDPMDERLWAGEVGEDVGNL